MLVSLIGSNGFLSRYIGLYCNKYFIELNVYGRVKPISYKFNKFCRVDLLCDELDYKDLAKSDIIIYAAGAGVQFHLDESKDAIYNLNVMLPISICNNLKKYKYQGAIFTFGSYFEIGENLENKSFSEKEILHSQLKSPNDYTISKRILTRYFESFNNCDSTFTKLHFILPTIYGETESSYRLIPYILNGIREDSNLTVTSGEQIRQYLYIEDVVSIIFSSIKANLESGIYNLCGAEEYSVKELVLYLFWLNKKEIPNNIFGKIKRVDTGMKILKLDGGKLEKKIGKISYHRILDVYKKYFLNNNYETKTNSSPSL
ncbi:MAG: NAD(P)-dependent oxidoreductase [Bacteroidetes bacterium]|nr:NAD(P)-dependent oxidoreductase [Bacteroidota bacterium]